MMFYWFSLLAIAAAFEDWRWLVAAAVAVLIGCLPSIVSPSKSN